MRKLASIQTVNAIEPISNADSIERLRVLGWWIVSKKGEHKVGDQIVYCEVDSLLPERAEFEFLRSSSFKPAQLDESGTVILPAGFRVRTVKLRGQVSQGLCLPLSILPSGAPIVEGADVTELLQIRKWEPPLPVGMGGKVKGSFPGFLPKTDETRVQVRMRKAPSQQGRPPIAVATKRTVSVISSTMAEVRRPPETPGETKGQRRLGSWPPEPAG